MNSDSTTYVPFTWDQVILGMLAVLWFSYPYAFFLTWAVIRRSSTLAEMYAEHREKGMSVGIWFQIQAYALIIFAAGVFAALSDPLNAAIVHLSEEPRLSQDAVFCSIFLLHALVGVSAFRQEYSFVTTLESLESDDAARLFGGTAVQKWRIVRAAAKARPLQPAAPIRSQWEELLDVARATYEATNGDYGTWAKAMYASEGSPVGSKLYDLWVAVTGAPPKIPSRSPDAKVAP